MTSYKRVRRRPSLQYKILLKQKYLHLRENIDRFDQFKLENSKNAKFCVKQVSTRFSWTSKLLTASWFGKTVHVLVKSLAVMTSSTRAFVTIFQCNLDTNHKYRDDVIIQKPFDVRT